MTRIIGACVVALSLAACDGAGDGLNTGGTAGSGTAGSGGGTAGGGAGTGGGMSGTGGSMAGTGGGATTSGTGGIGGDFAPESIALCNVVNEYRASQGLAQVPISPALMTVAELHVADLSDHPEILDGNCNLHSWSDTSDLWSGCCYTPDHAQAQCMWSKPKEITASWGANQYPGSGYEISEAGAGSPEGALELWKGSPPHHDVILNADIWAGFSPWPGFGCGMKGGYGVVWFGDAKDPQTP
jgi:hypothetical protein